MHSNIEGNPGPRNGYHSPPTDNDSYGYGPGHANAHPGFTENPISEAGPNYDQDAATYYYPEGEPDDRRARDTITQSSSQPSSSSLFSKFRAKTKTTPQYASVERSSDADAKYEKAAKSGHTWTVEFCAVALSLAAVVTTLVLLVYADGLPLERYNFIISFNAVISILGAIARVNLGFALGSCLGQGKWNFFKRKPASIVAFEKFEDASRGPWGSLWLLVWLKLKHWVVIGAIITILLLGFEPFLQSVIYYEGTMEPVSKSLIASLHRSTYLDAGKFYTTRSGGVYSDALPNNMSVTLTPFTNQPDLGMLAALYNGFYNGTGSADLTTSFLCPSGNCTWPPFTSIAACSACNDLTGQLKREEKFGRSLGTLSSNIAPISDTYLTYSLPYVSLANAVNTFMFSAYMSAVPRTQPKDTVSFKDLNTMITSVGMIRADRSFAEKAIPWNETSVTATECALYLCTKAFRSEVKDGALEENVIASWADRNMDSYTPLENHIVTPDEIVAYEEFYDHPLYVSTSNLERSDLELRIPVNEAEKHNLPLAENTGPNGTTIAPADDKEGYLSFTITQNTIGSMMGYIEDGFFQRSNRGRGSQSSSSSSGSDSNSGNGRKRQVAVDEDGQVQVGGDESEAEEEEEDEPLVWPNDGSYGSNMGSQPPVVQALYDSANLRETFGSAARSLTNWMRDQSDETAPGGVATRYVVRIRVRWAYLALPAGAIAAGCLFMLAVVLETRRLGLAPWKSDVLPTLVHALDPETRARLRLAAAADADAAVTALSEKGNKMKGGSILRKEAETTIVALERIEDGPQLKAIRRADEVRLHVPGAAHSDSGSVGMTPPVDEQGRNSRERPPTGTWV